MKRLLCFFAIGLIFGSIGNYLELDYPEYYIVILISFFTSMCVGYWKR